jgi:phosphomannomutase
MTLNNQLAPIFKAYDIRGIVPGELDARRTYAIGHGFATFVRSESGAQRVLVAHDMRTTGEELSRAFIAGAAAAGAHVVDLGLASTDMAYFASGHLDAPTAMLTASHNPAAYNGVKMCLAGARPIGRDTGLGEILRLAEEAVEQAPADGAVGSVAANPRVERVELLDAFAEHVRSFVDVSALTPMRIVADTANGMGGLVAPHVFAGLPFALDLLFGELDGTFPNHPADPIQPSNLVDLRARILETHADVGLAFDGDADRVFLVDERAEPLSGSTTTAIVADAMLRKHPGSTVLYNLICSHAVPEVIAEAGGVAVRTRVGHSFIKTVMAETDAVFGGEHSGHYYFRDNFRADSGIIAALVVLEVLSAAGVSLSELRKPYERYADSGEINTEVHDPASAIEAIAEQYGARGAALDRLDGLTAELADWWFNLRPSNTEPLLRLNVEARDADSLAAHVAELRDAIASIAAKQA